MELQSQLESERDLHTATREALRSVQREQQKLAAAAQQAGQASEALQEEQEEHGRTREQLRALQVGREGASMLMAVPAALPSGLKKACSSGGW